MEVSSSAGDASITPRRDRAGDAVCRAADEMVEFLAYHFGRAGEDDKAVDYEIRAAEKAQRHWAYTEA